MLGELLSDPEGRLAKRLTSPDWDAALQNRFSRDKEVRQVKARWNDEEWLAYEIHMGRTEGTPFALRSARSGKWRVENGGWRRQDLGTYCTVSLISTLREELARSASCAFRATQELARALASVYNGMADLLDAHLE